MNEIKCPHCDDNSLEAHEYNFWRKRKRLYWADGPLVWEDRDKNVRANWAVSAMHEIAASCGLTVAMAPTKEEAQHIISFDDKDPLGTLGGVLAYAWLPFSKNYDETGTKAGNIVIDSAEKWGDHVNLRAVFLHEMLHAVGMPHFPNEHSIMRPYYSKTIQHLTDFDKKWLKMVYPQGFMRLVPRVVRGWL